jgi:hypothetical protein
MTRLPVAAIVTEYRKNSHAELLVGKILDGYRHDGGPGPDLRLVSLYVDQFPANDLSRALARERGLRLCGTIAEALTLNTSALQVAGVLLIGEHGTYPRNGLGQILYPRRRFLAETCAVFARVGKAVPVFTDKHLAAEWTDAAWMMQRVNELGVPLLAGSSLPVTWRTPDLHVPRETPLTAAVQVGYGPLEAYGFHALEALQCLLERRVGGETGVRAVQCLSGAAMWAAVDAGVVDAELLTAAMKLVPSHAAGDVRTLTQKTNDAALFVLDYHDGTKAAVAMLNGWAYEGDGGAFCWAGRARGQVLATLFYLQQPEPFAHFGEQLKAIAATFRSHHSAYPPERTLLTTGILAACLQSRAAGGSKLPTPHLAIRYTPTDWQHARGPVPGR